MLANTDQLRREATEHLQAGHLQQAEHTLNELLKVQPDDADALNLLGMIAGQRGDYIAASRMLRKAVRIKPDQPILLNNLALALREAGKPEEAVTSLQKAIELDPTLAQAYNNLGSTLKRLGHMKDALAAYQQAVRLNPNYADACFNLGRLLRRSGKLDEAEKILKTTLQKNKGDFEMQRQLGLVYLDKGKYKDAERVFIASLQSRLTSKNHMKKPVQPRKSYRDLARNALVDFKHAMDKSSADFFLRSGTLLGYVREGDLLEHDKDIDIGVFENLSLDIVGDVLQKTGNFTLQPDKYSGQNKVSLTVFHNNGTPFDIYMHKGSGEYYLVEYFNPGGSFTRRFTRFDLKSVSFLGATFNVPDNPELYLTEIYGNDWHIPKPFFDSRVSSMNMEPGMEIISRCYAYCRIGGALERSDMDRAAAYCEQMLDKFPEDKITLEVRDYLINLT